jgi:hypothetical protein
MAQSYRAGDNRSVERPAIGRRASEGQADCAAMLIPGPVELPQPAPADGQLPRADEMLDAVAGFLAADVAGQLPGSLGYLVKVAANTAAIAAREASLGSAFAAAEHERLEALLGVGGTIGELRRRLVAALREDMPLDRPGLAGHLRSTVAGQLAIDQPDYRVAEGD